jgi:Cu/Ag efflux protein CusF
MAVVGIDLGSQSTKAVILEGDEILGGASLATGESAETEARMAVPPRVENPPPRARGGVDTSEVIGNCQGPYFSYAPGQSSGQARGHAHGHVPVRGPQRLLTLIKDYAQLYPNVPEDRAKVMLNQLADLEQQLVETRNSYLKKMQEVISPAKTLRYAQVESRFDLLLRNGMASAIPLVPVEGRLSGEAAGAVVVKEGVAGAAVVQTYELKATVTAVDKAARKVTLMDSSGIKTTVKAGPEVVNFDQIRIGDQLLITAAQELVVSVVGEGEATNDGGDQVVALAPKGAKPGAIMAETMQVTAKVTAIDVENRKATLQFDDGSTRTVAVRPDVDLSKRKIGDKVVIRTTGALAIRVVKP